MNNRLLLSVCLSMSLLAGCDIEGEGEEDATAQLSSGGSSCDLTEIITSADRTAGNAGGIQCSSQIANADSYYAAAVSACESGQSYQSTYDTYVQVAHYAQSANESMSCGAGSSPDSSAPIVAPAPESPSRYNLCVGYSNGGQTAHASCYGPVTSTNTGCGTSSTPMNYFAQYSSSSFCAGQRDYWLNNLAF